MAVPGQPYNGMRRTSAGHLLDVGLMDVRLATISDALGIAQVQVTTWRAAYQGIVPDSALAELSVEKSASGWSQALAAGAGHTLVACAEEDQVIGFSALGATRDADALPGTGEVYAFYVLPQYWGTGTGYRLWRATHALLRQQGFSDVTLWVLAANERGRRFYERMGLTLEPSRKGTYEVGGCSIPDVMYRAPLI